MAGSLTAHITLKPNCELENTRAALIVRRIKRLCDQVTAYPPCVRTDPRTIDYLRDHGLYIQFESASPDLVLLAIRSSFFVETCNLVDGLDNAVAYQPEIDGAPAFANQEADEFLASLSTSLLEETDRDEELYTLAARFESTCDALRTCARRHEGDRALEAALFEQERLTESLRTLVSHLRTKPFDSIIPALNAHASTYAARYKVDVSFAVRENRVELDRLTLASLEEMAKRLIGLIVRNGIDEAEARSKAGKPTQAFIRLELENEGSHVALHCTHDGIPFDVRAVAAARTLVQPVEEYSPEELGRLVFLPRLANDPNANRSNPSSDVNAIGMMLDRLNGYGTVCNLPDDTIRLTLRVPVGYTVCHAALVSVAGKNCAIPAASIVRFEAYQKENLCTESRDHYRCEDGTERLLANGVGGITSIAPESPRFVVTLGKQAGNLALAVDSADGYAQTVVRPLPPLVLSHIAEADLHLGWSNVANDTLRIVLNPQRLKERLNRSKESVHA